MDVQACMLMYMHTCAHTCTRVCTLHVQIMYDKEYFASYRGTFCQHTPPSGGEAGGQHPPHASLAWGEIQVFLPSCTHLVRAKGCGRASPNPVPLPCELRENCSFFSYKEIFLQFYFIIVTFRNRAPCVSSFAPSPGPWASRCHADTPHCHSLSMSVQVCVSFKTWGEKVKKDLCLQSILNYKILSNLSFILQKLSPRSQAPVPLPSQILMRFLGLSSSPRIPPNLSLMDSNSMVSVPPVCLLWTSSVMSEAQSYLSHGRWQGCCM